MAIEETSLERCPICFSILITPYVNLAQVATYLQEQNALPLSVEISEDNPDLEDLVIIGLNSLSKEGWKRDPILTKRGFAGNSYKGLHRLYKEDLTKLQERRHQQEVDVGIPELNQTVFSPINTNGAYTFWTKKHIFELRQSTEKIVKQIGLVKTVDGVEMADLESYFNSDENGTYIGTFKYGNKIADKTDWSDVDRAIEKFLYEPKFPEGVVSIKNIHIEDLRHSLLTGWVESFINILPLGTLSDSNTIWQGELDWNRSKNSDVVTSKTGTGTARVTGALDLRSELTGDAEARASGSYFIDMKKPLAFSLSANSLCTDPSFEIIGDVNASSFTSLLWRHDYSPNVLLNDNSGLFVDITGNWSDPSSGLNAVSSNYIQLETVIKVTYGENSEFSVFIGDEWKFTSGSINPFDDYSKILKNGVNVFRDIPAITLKNNPSIAPYVNKKYYLYNITEVRATSQALTSANIHLSPGSSTASASMDISINRFGII